MCPFPLDSPLFVWLLPCVLVYMFNSIPVAAWELVKISPGDFPKSFQNNKSCELSIVNSLTETLFQ